MQVFWKTEKFSVENLYFLYLGCGKGYGLRRELGFGSCLW